MVAPDSDNAEDLPQPSGPGTSASLVSTSTPAADGKLIGFSCPVCGYLRPAETRQPRARAKSSDRRLTCSDTGVERLRSGADSGSRVQRPTAKSL
jgi:hypothetical protein